MLREGLAELLFDGGASVILEGPAAFEPQSAAYGILSQGRLTARAAGRAHGFTIRTPQAAVSDLGTEFGVAAELGGRSNVEVFIGNVEVRPGRAGSGQRLRAGEAVQVLPVAAGLPRIVRVAAGSQPFIRSLPSQPPSAHSAARLRAIVALNPHLIHHYTFEGESLGEKLCDRRGNLPLGELAMRNGRGNGAIDHAAAGFDATARALRPYRALYHGNTRGVALQSEAMFQPPKAMTVELLLSFADPGEGLEGAIFAAVATRASRRDCGFLVATLGRGQIAVLLDGRARWLESGFSMVPGDWYYLASTFDTAGGRTVVNCYVANLSTGQRTLDGVIRDQRVAGALRRPAGDWQRLRRRDRPCLSLVRRAGGNRRLRCRSRRCDLAVAPGCPHESTPGQGQEQSAEMTRVRLLVLMLISVCTTAGSDAAELVVLPQQTPWSSATPWPLRTLSGHRAPVRLLAFSPDCKTLASGSSPGTVILWDLGEGKPSAALHAHVAAKPSPNNGEEGIKDLAFTPDGKILVTGSSDGTIEFWNVASADRQRTLPRLGDRLQCLAQYQAGGKTLATGNVDGTVNLWDTATGNRRSSAWRGVSAGSRTSPLTRPTRSSPVARTAASDSGSTTATPVPKSRCRSWRRTWACCRWRAPRGNALAAGHAGGPITLWNRTGPVTRRILAGHGQDVSSMAFAPDGTTLASASLDGTIKLWDVATGHHAAHWMRTQRRLALAYSADGQILASGGQDQQIRLWETSRPIAPTSTSDKTPAPAMTEPPRAPQAYPGETAAISRIKRLGGRFLVQGCKSSWSPDGKRLVFGDGGRLKIIELGSGRVRVLTQPGKDPAWSPGDGRRIAYVVGDGQSEEVWLIEAAGGAPRKLARGGFPSWSADAKTVFLHSQAGSKLAVDPPG